MSKINCWEFKKCGREPEGAKVSELGICPAAVEFRVNAINGGKNGGRACWVVAGTLCGGKIQGTFAIKMGNCLECNFYQRVAKEEGPKLQNLKDILVVLKV
jgi:hypothetical protein